MCRLKCWTVEVLGRNRNRNRNRNRKFEDKRDNLHEWRSFGNIYIIYDHLLIYLK